MHGKTGTPRQASMGGHPCHIETTQRATPPVHGDLRTDEPSAAVRIPPFAVTQDNSWARQWPLQSSLELGALPGAVPCARLHTRQMLWEWRLTGLSDIIELLISELVTNAVQISRADAQTTPVRLWVLADRTRVLILVWDSSPLPPVRMSTSEDDENGRGLLLVETLSTRWDWYFPPQQNGGKVVWALVQLSTGHGSHDHGTNFLRKEVPPAMSSRASHNSATSLPQAACEPAPTPVSAPGTALPLRPQSAGADARQWPPPDPEILRRVKTALTRL